MGADTQNIRRRYGDYDIETLIGKGSIGKVYLARHRRIGRRAALKVIDSDQPFEDDDDRDEFYRRLQREAELCGALQHPNIVTLYEAGYDGEVVSWLATEYVAGESLQSRLKRTRPLPLGEALSIGADLLRGLAYAHAQGVIHRDIKPANILVSNEGNAKIADFGIARPVNSSLTGVNSLLGTPNYMSPEQVKSAAVSTRSDLFSVGVVMYEMLCGVRPFAAPELSGILFNVVNLDPPRVNEVNPSVPAAAADVVAKLMAKSPADRFGAADEALAIIDAQRASLRSALEYATIGLVSDSTTPLPTVIDEPRPPGTGSDSLTVASTPSNPITLTSLPEGQALIARPIPAPVFWSVIILLLAGFGASTVALQSRIRREQPQAVITHEQQSQANTKLRELTYARRLAATGKYDEAIARYDAYLARFPESATARAERAEAQRLLVLSTKTNAVVTTTASKAKRKPAPVESAEPKQEKQPSRWERFKNWMRGDGKSEG